MSATLHRTEGEREAFAAWVKSCPWVEFSDYAWQAWKTRAALSGWQPIETAPKDGSAVLAFWGTDSEVEITARRYGITRWSGGTWLSVDDPDDEYIDPAFWMPLPPAPNQGEAS